MNLIASGINHKSAPLVIREQVAIAQETAKSMLRDLMTSGAANEALVLSTCNRTEIYAYTSSGEATLKDWLAQHPQTAQIIHSNHWYWHHEQEAIKHILRVATGVDSMMIGESQILGQMKRAFSQAQEVGSVGSYLNRLLQRVFSVARQIRHHTAIGANPVSVAYAAVILAKRIYSELSNCHTLLIGSGQTIELTALHLKDFGVKRMVFCNRSIDKAKKLAEQFGAHAIESDEIPLYLQQAHIVISATSSPLPIIKKNTVECALKLGKRRDLLMIDLGIPRDIEPQTADLEGVYLYHLDHLQEIVSHNLQSRYESARCAEDMIEIQARYVMKQLQSLTVVDTIRAYREKLEALRRDEVAKAHALLNQGVDAKEVVGELARTLTNKIMHASTSKLHQAGFDGQTDMLLLARNLLDI